MCPTCLLGLASLANQSPQPGTTPFPSAGFVAPSPAELAGRFPQLEILELLGQGGMGAVYKARQPKLDRMVAVKILPPEWGKDPAFAERFAREAKALARLTHPHIVAVHDFGESNGLFYLVMEYVDGANLRHLLQEGRMKPAEALAVIPQICDALQYAHEEGVVHRDIKPENILLDSKGRVKIADFGLAKLLNRPRAAFTLTGSQQVMGTLDYMAPEQRLRPQEVDHRADIYSLGVVFYEMLTGELPLGRFEPPSHKVRVDARLDEIVFRALEREPGRRYQRASHVKMDVESLANGRALALRPQPRPAASAVPEVASGDEFSVVAPAAGLMLAGVIGILFWTVMGLTGAVIERRQPGGAMFLLMPAFALPAGVGLIIGAMRMMRFRSYHWAIGSAIWAMIPWSPGWLIGLPCGILALRALRKPSTQAAFGVSAQERNPVLAPAVGIFVTGVAASLFWTILGIGLCASEPAYYPEYFAPPGHAPGPTFHANTSRYLFLLMPLIGISAAAILVIGARRMMQRRSYHFAVLAAMWATIPWSPFWLIGLPFGIMALRALGRREVQIAFGQPFEQRESAFERPMADIPVAIPANEPPQPTGPARRGVRAFVGSMYSLMFHSRVENPSSQKADPAAPNANRAVAEPAARGQALFRGPAAVRGPVQTPAKGHTLLWVFCIIAVVALLVSGAVAILTTRQAAQRALEMRAQAEYGFRDMVILGNRYRDLVTTTHLDQYGFGPDVERVFRSTEAEYLALESRFTKRERKEGNRVRISIGKFPEEVKELESLFLNKLQTTTHGTFMNDFRRQLPENKIFPFGSKDVRIELWREDGLYHGKVSQEVPDGQAGQVKMVEKAIEEFSGPELPPMYKRFWIEPDFKGGATKGGVMKK
jgi:tRNA A-37 threonylcarbamoyl transferase component Bud32